MSSLLVAVGIALSCVLLVPSAFFMIECLASRRRGRPEMIPVRAPKVAILVPAHDEAQSIENTLAELMQAVDAGMRVLVVADNCSDDTAKRAAIAGARARAFSRMRAADSASAWFGAVAISLPPALACD
mgnify:CR=1 FL=1